MKKNYLTIGLIIFGATLGIILVIVRLLNGRNIHPSEENYTIPTNNLIENTANIPDSCQLVIDLFDCINQSALDTGNKQSLTQYFPQLLSERNTSSDGSELEKKCSEYYSYMISLDSPNYGDTIASCRKA